jgi:SnoaL-like domain
MTGEETAQQAAPAWGHELAELELTAGELASGADAVDRQLVVERVSRYCWGYDERRRELLADCFVEDAVWEGSVMGRIVVGPMTGRAAIVAWLAEFWPVQQDQRRHMITNAVVEQLGAGRARVLAYLLLMSARRGQVRTESMGFYRIDLVKDGGVWRIAHLFAGFDTPFWPGQLDELSEKARRRHGLRQEGTTP